MSTEYQQEQTRDDREPTFSSEEGTRSSHSNEHERTHMPSPAEVATAFSSPAPGLFTPTPAFHPRPRARFNLPSQHSTTPQDDPGEEEETHDEPTWRAEQQTQNDPVTPHAHKRSFLMGVINSTAKPRRRFLPTPHPTRVQEESEYYDAPEDHTAIPATPATNLQSAFAGITPRPRGPARRRLSIPTTTSQSTAPSTQDTASGSESAYEEKASFISTTSSQDLTTHARANASFDPVIGLGDRGHGVGRFNAGKLNSYLHGLNRKLQEENETLVARLRAYEEAEAKQNPSQDATPSPGTSPYTQGRRRVSAGRRVSVGPDLGDVAEIGESFVEEKAALEDMIEELKESLDACKAEKEEAEEALHNEKAERARDKERWRDRMGEVEMGVENIVRELESKQHDAEEKARVAEEEKRKTIREVERRLAEVVVERDVLQERIEQAENALESGRDLGASMNAANERAAQTMSDLKNAEIEIKQLEDDVNRAETRIKVLESDLSDERQHNSELQEELDITVNKFSQAVKRVEELDGKLKTTQQELAESKEYINQLEQDAGAAVDRVQDLEQEVASLKEELEEAHHELQEESDAIQHLEEDNKKTKMLARQMEEALEAAEQRMAEDDEKLVVYKDKIASLERELDKSRSRIEPSQIAQDSELEAQIEELERELGEAHREIARLQTSLGQSPARKAIEKAKDAKIELLEKEKEDLQERLRSLKNQTMTFHTPGKTANNSGISPFRRHSLSVRSPKTPGGPLRDVSELFLSINLRVAYLSQSLSFVDVMVTDYDARG